jgi:hypothetical protein
LCAFTFFRAIKKTFLFSRSKNKKKIERKFCKKETKNTTNNNDSAANFFFYYHPEEDNIEITTTRRVIVNFSNNFSVYWKIKKKENQNKKILTIFFGKTLIAKGK